MKPLLRLAGRVLHWLAWPAYWWYWRRSPGRTRIAVVNAAGELLVVRQWISSGQWSLPGGGLHAGEPVVQGALRELAEETGLRLPASDLTWLGNGQHQERSLQFRFTLFGCRVDASTQQLRRQAIELSDMRWMTPAELDTAQVDEAVTMARQHWPAPQAR